MNSFVSHCCWILSLFVLSCRSLAPLPKENVVIQVLDALKDNSESTSLLRYMNMSDQELIAALPSTNTKGYSLFAPTDFAFLKSVPQDIGDPFFDPDLRNQVLIRHFVRQRLTKEELSKLTNLEMASGEIYNLTHINGITEIQVQSISLVSQEVIELDDINIFFVDYPFVSTEEISDAIGRHPSEEIFTGPLPQTPFDQLPKFPSGGYNRIAVDDERVVNFAQFAAQEISKKERNPLTLKKIQSAGTQSYYGELYKFVLELFCNVNNNSLVCQAVVFHRYVLNETILYESYCTQTTLY